MKELQLLREIASTQGYLALIGIEPIEAGPGSVREQLVVRNELLQPAVVHGGAIYSLADTAAAHAVLTLVYPAEWVTTVEQKINFLRPVKAGILVCDAKVIHLGNRIVYCEATVMNANELIARSTATLMRLKRDK